MNLNTVFQMHAKNSPGRMALGWENGFYTYEELNEEIQRLANQFLTNKLITGDRIAIILPNCPEFIISYYACMRSGLISVPINPSLTSRELNLIVNDCSPKYIITNKENLSKMKEFLKDTSIQSLVIDDFQDSFYAFLKNGSTDEINMTTYPEECTIIYTSGTTGLPKGAVLTHLNLYHNAKTYAEAFEMNEDERTLIVAPVFHTAAQTCCLNATVVSGGYNYLLERWTASSKTLNTLEQERITFFFGPPTMYTYMLNDPDVNNYDIKLRIAFSGAAPLPTEIFTKFRDTFGFEIVEGYGLSETSPVVTFNPPFGYKKRGSIGVPMKDIKVRIVDEQFQDVPTNEPGELLVKGPNVMKEYWNRVEENQMAFVNGWFRTGDVAKKDSDGYLYIVDRKKDMINTAGFKVYPREIEEIFYEHPAVLEVAVIGIPDIEKGEIVKAIVTIKEMIDTSHLLNELKEYCRKNLATYKVPKEIHIVEELPKTTSGKIMKNKLRDIFIANFE